jgi:hypothetical protein
MQKENLVVQSNFTLAQRSIHTSGGRRVQYTYGRARDAFLNGESGSRRVTFSCPNHPQHASEDVQAGSSSIADPVAALHA